MSTVVSKMSLFKLILTLFLMSGSGIAHGQSKPHKHPKYLIIHFKDGRQGKVLLNNKHIKVKLKNDGGMLSGPFQVDSNFLYNTTDTISIDGIQRFKTYNPGIAIIGGVLFVSALTAIVPAAVYVIYMLGSEPITWLIFLTPTIFPSLVILASHKRIKLEGAVHIEGRDKYPRHLSKENAIIQK